MTTIDITDAMKKSARRGEARIMATFKDLKNGNYTKLNEPDRFYNGILGELAFVKLLKQEGIRCQYRPTWDGTPDKGDIILYAGDYPLAADIKTCSKLFHENLWIPTKQYEKYSYNGYIGVRLNGDVAEIHGYCQKKDFTKTEHPGAKVANYGIALDKLRPIDRLLGRLDKGEADIKLPA